jgi:hypothetical protein
MNNSDFAIWIGSASTEKNKDQYEKSFPAARFVCDEQVCYPAESSAMSSNKPFSYRHGINPKPSPTVNAAPETLRYFLFQYLRNEHATAPHVAAEVIEEFLRRPGISSGFFNPHDPTTWSRFYALINAFEWWQIYDFIEFIFKQDKVFSRGNFFSQVNELFRDENICYRMDTAGDITYKGSEAFESIAATAELVLHATNKLTAEAEIHKALENLSKRPVPDLTGAVQHAMAALECVATDVCGDKGETLGQVVKKHPDRFPPPIGQAVSMLYGFASDKGRHLTEGGEPDLKEVELVVGIAATVATYLSR